MIPAWMSSMLSKVGGAHHRTVTSFNISASILLSKEIFPSTSVQTRSIHCSKGKRVMKVILEGDFEPRTLQEEGE